MTRKERLAQVASMLDSAEALLRDTLRADGDMPRAALQNLTALAGIIGYNSRDIRRTIGSIPD